MTLPAALRTSAAHVFVEDLHDTQLDPADQHHLARVLRLRDGEPVTLGDGRGSWRTGRWRAGQVAVDGDVEFVAQAERATIAAAIPKGDRLEWMVQKLVEVGVARIVLVDCQRSVVRWSGERRAAQLARLGRVMREAAMQSRRVWLPQLEGPRAVADVAATDGAVLADPDGPPLHGGSASVVVIGPEGGLTAQERALAPCASLGPEILRVETAAVVAAILTRHV